MKNRTSLTVVVLISTLAWTSVSFGVTDSFESYPVGDIHNQGAWRDFFGPELSVVTTEQAHTGTKSLKQTIHSTMPNPFGIPGYGSDVYQDLPALLTSGVWDLSYWIYVPSDFNGASILHLAQNHVDGSVDLEFGLQLVADGSDGFNQFLASQDGATGQVTPTLLRDQWSEVTATIDLDNNNVTAFYNGTEIFSGDWDPTAPISPSLGGFNFWVQGGDTGSIYIDDFSLVPEPNCMSLIVFGLLGMTRIVRRR